MNKWILVIGALLGASAVMSGAFGAHALQSVLSDRAAEWYDAAVTYHSTHALALLATGLLNLQTNNGHGCQSLRLCAWCFLGGVLAFSGSLYAMAFTGITQLGMITPIGGVLLITGWLCLALGARRVATGVS